MVKSICSVTEYVADVVESFAAASATSLTITSSLLGYFLASLVVAMATAAATRL